MEDLYREDLAYEKTPPIGKRAKRHYQPVLSGYGPGESAARGVLPWPIASGAWGDHGVILLPTDRIGPLFFAFPTLPLPQKCPGGGSGLV